MKKSILILLITLGLLLSSCKSNSSENQNDATIQSESRENIGSDTMVTLALGWKVPLPAARNGVLTAVMLGIGRTFDETMAVIINSDGSTTEVLDPTICVIGLRRRVGMVYARPIVLPLTIRGNLTYGLEVAGVRNKQRLDEAVEHSLRQAALWEEVADRLDDPAVALSGDQQQRLCLDRSLVLEPEIILLGEWTSVWDPISITKVEASLQELKNKYTVILVPHSVQQAARTADHAVFFLQGELIEQGPGKNLIVNPKDQRIEDYVEGRFG